MSVDGFSMSSLGLPKDITSAQAAVTAQNGVFSSSDKSIGKIDRILNKRINNDEEKEHQKNNFFNDGYSEEDEEDENKDEESKEESGNSSVDIDKKLSARDAARYKAEQLQNPEQISVKFNPAEEKIILYNNVTKKTLESINPDDFLEMINKLDYNSGVLVNKSI